MNVDELLYKSDKMYRKWWLSRFGKEETLKSIKGEIERLQRIYDQLKSE